MIRTQDKSIELMSQLQKTASQYFIKPNPSSGIQGFKMDIIGSQEMTLGSDVTDHYVESNTAYQDQISLKPIIYTISGEVGEVVFEDKGNEESPKQKPEQNLTTISELAPPITDSATQNHEAVEYVPGEDDISWDSFLTETQSEQEKAYLLLRTLRDARIPIDVWTPWTNLTNYVITSVRLSQPESSRDKTLITIEMKEFRELSLTYVEYDASKHQGRNAAQASSNVNQGQENGTEKRISTWDKLTGKK